MTAPWPAFACRRTEPRGAVARTLAPLLLCALVSAAAGRDPTPAPELVFPSSLGEVVFPHQAHFNDMEIECEACHHETNARMLDIPHVEYFADFWIDCATCHHPSSEPQRAMSCSACHHCPTHCADESLSSKVVIHASCWRCHEVGAGAAASAACATCHAGPQRAWGDGEGPSWIDGGS